MGRKCNVLDCPSDSRRSEDNGVTFHKMPFHPDLRPKWIELCRVPEERQSNKVIYVCSRHFRRTDFCNFKGTKYMLRQGALPSVFPWTRSLTKLPQVAKITVSPSDSTDDTNVEIKLEPIDTDSKSNDDEIDATLVKIKSEPEDEDDEEKPKIKKENIPTVKKDTNSENPIKPKINNEETTVTINFLPGTRIEANDFNDKWYPATILEVDYEENEVFVEFERNLNRANEWIPMDSSRLRAYNPSNNAEFAVGEKCMATWMKSCSKFPATIKRVLDIDTYEVLFDDGFSKILKQNKLSKMKNSNTITSKSPALHASPLFDPVVGSKEDRRERKRKLNVAELFGHRKKSKSDEPHIKSEIQEDDKPSHDEYLSPGSSGVCEGEEWTCRWLNGEPVGIVSTLEGTDGLRRSIIVPDHRLPSNWEKHLTQRMYGNSAGKWDTILVNPDGKKFTNRPTLKSWLEENKLDYNPERFDFSLHLNRARKLGLYEVTDHEALAAATKITPLPRPSGNKSKGTPKTNSNKVSTPKTGSSSTLPLTPEAHEPEAEEEDENAGCLKIIHENDSYKCPIEGCGKNFRKENLAQMHIKHYHPEYTKFIGSTPNVADLAYARTVGEHIDEIVPKPRVAASPLEKDKTIKSESIPKSKSTIKVLTPKISQKSEETDRRTLEKTPSISGSTTGPATPKSISKDSEIIKLLNSEPKSKGIDAIFDSVDSYQKQVTAEENATNQTSSEKYPEIKLKDLLSKSESIPVKKDEHRPTGIKTLLPVIRTSEEQRIEQDIDPEKPHMTIKPPDKTKFIRKRQSLDHNEIMKKRRQSLKYDTDEMSDYYEGDSHSQDSFKIKKVGEIASTQPAQDSQVIIEGGEVIRLVHMRSEEIINCTCGITEEDGLMIQCELCLCWQHAHCNNIERENQVPEKYVCKICKNPQRMRASKKYLHDQEWLKQGVLATASYHTKDGEILGNRFEKLRKSHELSGCLIELNEYIHNLRIKLNVAENKDHPKLYLWNKQWVKMTSEGTLNLSKIDPMKQEIKEENLNSSFSSSDHSYIKSTAFGDLALKTMLQPPIEEIKTEDPQSDIKYPLIPTDSKIKSQSELISILEDNEMTTNPVVKTNLDQTTEFPKIDLNSMIANNLADKVDLKEEVIEDNKENALSSITSGILSTGSLDLALSQTDLDRLSSLAQLSEVVPAHQVQQPHIPQPEAAIDPSDCRMNLLDHVAYYQNLVEERLNTIEAEICDLEEQESNPLPEDDENGAKTKQTIQMLIHDLTTMREISTLSN